MRSEIGIETHPEVNFSTLAICYGALVENLKEYHSNILRKGAHSFKSIPWDRHAQYLMGLFELIQENNS